MSDVELWNRILAHDCIELREFTWCELALMGYQWPEKKLGDQDILRASLLIHVLLRQHRCVTYIYLDLAHTALERQVLWHALKTGAMGVKRLEYRQNFIDIICVMPLTESTICCEAIASMTNITFLELSSMCFSKDVVRIIGTYVEQATSLTDLELLNIEATDTNAGRFLDHLARNRSLKYLHVHENFLLARQGRALADAVLNHVTLEELKVKGSKRHSPSALLAAVAHSWSLQSLTLLESFIDPADIEAMASALAIPSQPPDFDAEVIPPPPTSRLRKLSFTNCGPFYSQLQVAYANHWRQANKTLKALVLNMTTEHSQEDVSSLFDMVSRINAFSRLWLHWVYPRASDFPKSALTASTPSVSMILDDYEAEDAARALDTIASSCNLDMATIQCSANVKKAVLLRLADTLASTKSLQKIKDGTSLI
ncbi:uncharacterized protein LOC119376007 [Rhipicephalus sanguineus]|nr:uncharacterized protein LOC119376007 [Rhipicephalus sanguineus]